MKARRLLLSLTLGAAISAPALAAEERVVQYKEAPVREKPVPISPTVGKLQFGEKVTVLESPNDAWRRIESASKISGWIRASALEEPAKFTKNTGEVPAGVTGGELLNAGKGINPEMERDYVTQNNLQNQLAALDAIEANPLFKADYAEKQAFLTQGNLVPKE